MSKRKSQAEDAQVPKNIVIYQAKSGAIELRGDFNKETIWANRNEIAQIFDTDSSGIFRHIKNILKSGELSSKTTIAKNAIVQKEGKRNILRQVEYYNLDMIVSIGYRVNSKKATQFRQWATKTLRSHIVEGYTINRSRIAKNYAAFLEAVEQVKALLPAGNIVDAESTLELVKLFAGTWFSLDAYDKSAFPKKGLTKSQVSFAAHDLQKVFDEFKRELLAKDQATELFGVEKQRGDLSGIVGNIFQAFGGNDLYPTVEEKAAHLLYFIIKNHPFTDGNKRSGAFAFVWFLKKTKILDVSRLTPEALTTLTLLVAESNPQDKDRVLGLVLLLLRK